MFIRSNPGSYPGEGIQTVNITAPKFSGGLLLGNNEKCKQKFKTIAVEDQQDIDTLQHQTIKVTD